jgi:hypothetical protein
MSLEVYYLGLDRRQATFERGTAHEVRHSLGARTSRPVATEGSGLDFDYEGVWQFGTFGSRNIRAWTVASETGYRFPTAPLKPRFSVKADISSGDNPRSKTLATFNPFFRRETTLESSPQQDPVRLTSSTFIRMSKQYFRTT